MKISKEQVYHIAKLARIRLKEAEVEKFQKELASVLGYFEILKEVDVSAMDPTTHSVAPANVTRKDAARPQTPAHAAELLAMASATQNGYVKVKPIL